MTAAAGHGPSPASERFVPRHEAVAVETQDERGREGTAGAPLIDVVPGRQFLQPVESFDQAKGVDAFQIPTASVHYGPKEKKTQKK